MIPGSRLGMAVRQCATCWTDCLCERTVDGIAIRTTNANANGGASGKDIMLR